MKTADSDELKAMGREIASAVVKGNGADTKVHPSDQVPLVTLMYVANQHGITNMDPDDFRNLARAMDEALEEAARWQETDEQALNASKGG